MNQSPLALPTLLHCQVYNSQRYARLSHKRQEAGLPTTGATAELVRLANRAAPGHGQLKPQHTPRTHAAATIRSPQ
jgi:hypothetical protein